MPVMRGVLYASYDEGYGTSVVLMKKLRNKNIYP